MAKRKSWDSYSVWCLELWMQFGAFVCIGAMGGFLV